MNRLLISAVLLFFLLACSEDSTGPGENGGITDGQLAQLYRGSISIEYTGGYVHTAGSDTLTGTAITQPDMNHYITMQDLGLGIAFVGLTNGGNKELTFIDSTTTLPGTILGTINDDNILLISKSGTFSLTSLNANSFKGSFQGEFEGFQGNVPVTATVSATFSLTGAFFSKGSVPSDEALITLEKAKEKLDQVETNLQ